MIYEVYCVDKYGNEYFRSNEMLLYDAIKECCKYGDEMEVWVIDETGEYLAHVCKKGVPL